MGEKYGPAMRGLKAIYWRLTPLLAGLAIAVFAFLPEWREGLVMEDRFLESLTAALFVGVFIFGLKAFASPCQRPHTPHFALVIPLLGLFGFLDETSFCGLLAGGDNPSSSGLAEGTESPIVLPGGYIIDGVHDFFTLPFKVWRDQADFTGYVIGSIFIGLVIGLMVVKRRSYMPWIMRQVRSYPPYDYLRHAIILIMAAMVLDLDLGGKKWGLLAEELLETVGALALFFGAVAMNIKPSSEQASENCSESSPD